MADKRKVDKNEDEAGWWEWFKDKAIYLVQTNARWWEWFRDRLLYPGQILYPGQTNSANSKHSENDYDENYYNGDADNDDDQIRVDVLQWHGIKRDCYRVNTCIETPSISRGRDMIKSESPQVYPVIQAPPPPPPPNPNI